MRVGTSKFGPNAGEGLFLKVPAKAGSTVAFYNGVRIPPGEVSPVQNSAYQIYLDWTASRVTTSEFLDILPQHQSLDNYCASLGHKINHSFEPNCRWDNIEHPTFGRVPRIVTMVDLEAGEEVTCHYMINIGEAYDHKDFKWYADLWDHMSAK